MKTEIYLIFKCKLDSGIKNEVNFNPLNGPSVRSPATLQNEYILSVDAPGKTCHTWSDYCNLGVTRKVQKSIFKQ